MIKQIAVVALGVVIATSSAQAQQVLLRDTFDTENGGAGATQLNYNAFANWNVTGQVDLVKSGAYGITCSGSCVDLDGSTGPGALASKLTYSFNAGDVMRFTARIGGAQRGQTALDWWDLGFEFVQPTDIAYLSVNYGSGFTQLIDASPDFEKGNLGGLLPGSAEFQWYGFEWRAAEAGSVRLSIKTSSADNIGPILDEVLLERTSATVPEPGSFALIGTGLLALGGVARRRRV